MRVQKYEGLRRGQFFASPHQASRELHSNAKTCSGRLLEPRGWRQVARPPSRAAKVRRTGAANSQPLAGPGSLESCAGGSGTLAPPRRQRKRASLVASPRELAPRGRRGGDAADPSLSGAPRGGFDPPPLFHTLSLPRTTKYGPSPLGNQVSPRKSHCGLGRPRPVAPFWSD